MTMENQAPWTEAESHLQSAMTLAQAKQRARQLTPTKGFWRIESGEVQPKSGDTDAGPKEKRHTIYIWLSKYSETHKDTTLAAMTYIAKTLSESVNAQAGPQGTGWDIQAMANGQFKLTAWKV